MNKLLLEDLHREIGAKFFEFAGWRMPQSYNRPSQEHLAVRDSVGIFDVSHMGRFKVTGKDAWNFIQRLTTNDAKLLAERAMYTLLCNENGGIVDDAIFSKTNNEFTVVVNAVSREKDYKWVKRNIGSLDVQLKDQTFESVMFAVQGPRAEETLQKLTDHDLSGMKRFGRAEIKLSGLQVSISRTGYTGEDGFEIIYWEAKRNRGKAEKLWRDILKAGKEHEIKPCGLIARDTLRLEAGMVLYGSDIDENTTPLEAKLDFVVKFGAGDFIGRDALLKQREAGVKRVRIGFKMIERGFPRRHNKIYINREEIGEVTSSAKTPLIAEPIGIGYIKAEHYELGKEIKIKTITGLKKAKIVKTPFYDTEKYGYLREK